MTYLLTYLHEFFGIQKINMNLGRGGRRKGGWEWCVWTGGICPLYH